MDDKKPGATPFDIDTPMFGNPTPDEQDDFIETFCNSPYVPKSKPGRRKTTPHALLKHRCRNALTAWRQAHGVSVVLLPSIVGKIKTMQGKEIAVGKRGQADDTLLVLGRAIAIEYKASYQNGADHQSDVQKRFQDRWEAAGGIYVICRAPADMTAVLTKVMNDAAQSKL